MLLQDFFDTVFLPSKPDTSGKTIRLYGLSIRKFSQWLERQAKLKDLTDSNVGRFMLAMRAKGNTPGTCNKDRAHLLAIWRMANTIGKIRVGPTVQRMTEPRRIPLALEVEQLRKLVDAFGTLKGETAGLPNSDFLRACFFIQFATGERIGAVLQLEFTDIVGEIITFRSETRKGRTKPMIKAVPGFVLEAIKRIKNPSRVRLFPVDPESTKIFLLYDRLFKRAGVDRPKGKSSHLLRSTHATMIFLAGGDPTKSLGHASREVTNRSYIDPRHEPDRSCDLLPKI